MPPKVCQGFSSIFTKIFHGKQGFFSAYRMAFFSPFFASKRTPLFSKINILFALCSHFVDLRKAHCLLFAPSETLDSIVLGQSKCSLLVSKITFIFPSPHTQLLAPPLVPPFSRCSAYAKILLGCLHAHYTSQHFKFVVYF